MKPIRWENDSLILLNQTLLPLQVEEIVCTTYSQVADAIRTMKVRGAPAIGVAAAYGLLLAALGYDEEDKKIFAEVMEKASKELAGTRPTAVNLFWALARMARIWEEKKDLTVGEVKILLEDEARKIEREDLEINKRIGLFGSKYIMQGANILTHCNAGALATAGYGTALGVIRTAHAEGKNIHVFVDETRPLLQGARLTAWELKGEDIPLTLITDNMAAYLMQQGKIDLVIVGADRITAAGDVANKIGTYGLAVLARYHSIPFYVAAPLSTIDMSLEKGKGIPIEERDHDEVRKLHGVQIAPAEVKVYNPAFDVTPAELITAIITEKGVVEHPLGNKLSKLFG